MANRVILVLMFVASIVTSETVLAQSLTGTLIVTVKDAQGGVLIGAAATARSAALMGGQTTVMANEKGQVRFQALPPGRYSLEISMPGFADYTETNIEIGAGATLERTVALSLAGIAADVEVQGGSRIDARNSGVETRFGTDYMRAMPGRR